MRGEKIFRLKWSFVFVLLVIDLYYMLNDRYVSLKLSFFTETCIDR